MGEIAEMMLDGLMSEDGEWLGDVPDPVEKSKALNQARVAAALPFPCPGCGRTFKHKGDLRVHRRAKAH